LCGVLFFILSCDGTGNTSRTDPVLGDTGSPPDSTQPQDRSDADTVSDAQTSDALASTDARASDSSEILPDPYIVVSSPGPYRALGAGREHNCAIRSAGTVHCWGRGTTVSGCGGVWQNPAYCASLGVGWPYCSGGSGFSPDCGQALPPPGEFTKLALGRAHSCALRTDGVLLCWGYAHAVGPYGCDPVGDGGSRCALPDDAGAAASRTFVDVAAHDHGTCAVQSDGRLTCWGDLASLPVPSGGQFRRVVVATYHVCALAADGSVSCWGSSPGGWQIPVAPAGPFSELSLAANRVCALRADGSVQCWGGPETATGPEWLPPAGRFVELTAESTRMRSCALDAVGDPACWGSPQAIRLSGPWPAWRFVRIALGPTHTCGIMRDGSVACWGDPYIAGAALRSP
jgi:alpha-tubulin suppressor-like RCC1 family protein